MLGKTEGRRRRERLRMSWSEGITQSMDTSLSKFQEAVKNRDAWHAAGPEAAEADMACHGRTAKSAS